MKKVMKLMMVFGLAFAIAPCVGGRTHDQHCGYNPETGTGCMYEVMPANSEHLGW